MVLTDSGGLQEETTALGCRITIREKNTERPVTVDEGTNVLVGTDPARVVSEVRKGAGGEGKQGRRPDLWDGCAADRIVQIVCEGTGMNERIEMMGCQIDNLTMEETLGRGAVHCWAGLTSMWW